MTVAPFQASLPGNQIVLAVFTVGLQAAGPIDNAGIGFARALEGISMQAIRDIFETNTFGTLAMIQAVLPQFRQRKSGVVVTPPQA